jgi:hypothetical protein
MTKTWQDVHLEWKAFKKKWEGKDMFEEDKEDEDLTVELLGDEDDLETWLEKVAPDPTLGKYKDLKEQQMHILKKLDNV